VVDSLYIFSPNFPYSTGQLIFWRIGTLPGTLLIWSLQCSSFPRAQFCFSLLAICFFSISVIETPPHDLDEIEDTGFTFSRVGPRCLSDSQHLIHHTFSSPNFRDVDLIILPFFCRFVQLPQLVTAKSSFVQFFIIKTDRPTPENFPFSRF